MKITWESAGYTFVNVWNAVELAERVRNMHNTLPAIISPCVNSHIPFKNKNRIQGCASIWGCTSNQRYTLKINANYRHVDAVTDTAQMR